MYISFKIKLFVFLSMIGWITLSSCTREEFTVDYRVVPLPHEVTLQKGIPSFILRDKITIGVVGESEKMKRNAEFLKEYLEELGKAQIAINQGEGDITLLLDESIEHPEGYKMTVDNKGVRISGKSEAGVFYGIQTLRKSLPVSAVGKQIEMPAVTIHDYPRFGYRGMHLDVARHFFTLDSVKIYIDMMALHNQNKFHWHLIDDQGWRIEIKKYPELINTGAKRKETVIGRNSGEYDGKEYGPYYYTQDQIRELVAYAEERYITVIPEIDLPGHQQAALATYPEFGCTGGPYDVWTQWGVSEDVICAGNEKALRFLEDVLAEVAELFPSEYIHIGGDECPKVRWAKCPKCQARIKSLGIKKDKKHTAEEYLQSYVMTRMENFLATKGKRVIGWDEILEGGLGPNVTIMSWRGMSGGIQAANMHHDVIMTPTDFCYFDYYQTDDVENEPFGFGGYVPVEKVYSLEPTAGIPEENKKYVLGAQANLWVEYIKTFRHAQYMVLPRMAALSEVQWTDPSQKDYKDFLPRVARLTKLYDLLGYNYAKHIFEMKVDVEPDTVKNVIRVTLGNLGDGHIYYTLDGSEPTNSSREYKMPVEIKKDTELKAVLIRNNEPGKVYSQSFHFNKATAKPISLKYQPNRNYTFNGASQLVDGVNGDDNFKKGTWLGFQGRYLDAVIDLQHVEQIGKVFFNTNVRKGSWLMGVREIKVEVSEDGNSYKEVATKTYPSLKQEDEDGIYPHEIEFSPVKARFIRVVINGDTLPEWHGGAGRAAFVFVDEIGVE